MDEHRKKFKLGASPTYLTIHKWPLEYLLLEFFRERTLGQDRLLLRRTKKGNETGVKLRVIDVEKIALIFRKQYEGSQGEKYVKGDCGTSKIQNGLGKYKDWTFEPIVEIPGEDPHKRINFKLLSSPTMSGEWYFLIYEYYSRREGDWKREGGVEIEGKMLGEIAKIFEECIPCMKR